MVNNTVEVQVLASCPQKLARENALEYNEDMALQDMIAIDQ